MVMAVTSSSVHPASCKTKLDGFSRETRPMFDSTEALLFGCNQKLSIHKNGR